MAEKQKTNVAELEARIVDEYEGELYGTPDEIRDKIMSKFFKQDTKKQKALARKLAGRVAEDKPVLSPYWKKQYYPDVQRWRDRKGRFTKAPRR